MSPLIVEELLNDQWRLLQSLTARIDDYYLSVPVDFVTDFGSVPRLPIAYLLTANKGRKACVLHDFVYSNAMFPRDICDEILYHALRAEGVGWFAAKMMYAGVRLGGGAFYRKVS